MIQASRVFGIEKSPSATEAARNAITGTAWRFSVIARLSGERRMIGCETRATTEKDAAAVTASTMPSTLKLKSPPRSSTRTRPAKATARAATIARVIRS